MNLDFLKQYFLFMALLLTCLAGMGYLLFNGGRSVVMADGWVRHTYIIIGKGQQLTAELEKAGGHQRGFLLTADVKFKSAYDADKASIARLTDELVPMMQDNPAQGIRMAELQHHITAFLAETDRMLAETAKPGGGRPEMLASAEAVEGQKENIARLIEQMLAEEYRLLNVRVLEVEKAKNRYFAAVVIGGLGSAGILLLFNAFLMQAQSGRQRAERARDEALELFRLAMEGSNDGIFDWDLKTDRAFYTRQFWSMLGYEDHEFPANRQSFDQLICPDDKEQALEYLEQYLRGGLSEYSNVFRMKHKSGRWVWINARGKALYDQNGKPSRMIGAHTDISHIKAYEEKLEKAKTDAENANRAKTDFLAHMSHEIRTPLTAISGIAEIFERNKTNLDEKQKMLIKTLHSSTSSLKDLVNDILDFSKIESGELELERRMFSLHDLFEQVISIVSIRANEKGLYFRFIYDDVRDLKFMGDRIRLRQILINLIGNAIKFTDKGSVSVSVFSEGEGAARVLRIDVADTGIGIDPQNFDLIFERFKQADSSVSRKYGGTGLGLPISMRLARLMGGNITISSAPGEGSTFTLIVPFEAGTAHDSAVSGPAHAGYVAATQRAPGKKILMVEDYEGNIVVLSYLLDSLQYDYDVARTGIEALDKWKAGRYDLVLMDIQMPEMDGFAATAYIRKAEHDQGLARTPIIGMTAHALVGDKEKCIEAGMDAYLPKPIVEADLKAKIEEFLDEGRAAA